jgi:hypothetical protein
MQAITPSVPLSPSMQPAALTPAPTPPPGSGKFGLDQLSTRAKYAIGGLVAVAVLFAVLFFNGKYNASVEYERMMQAQKQELEKLKAEIDLKTASLRQQQDLEAQQRRSWEELRTKQETRQRELDRERDSELQRLATLNDQKQAADAKARLDQKQREWEEEKRATEERRLRSERETREQMEALRRQVDNANQRSTTIITQPPPPPYPWWHHYNRYYPW